jgi:integrase
MGRIFKPPDCASWFIDYRDGKGNRVRKRVSGERRVAERILRELEREADLERAGLVSGATNDTSLMALWKAFRIHMETVGRSPSTIGFYDGLIPNFIRIVGAEKVKDLSPESVDLYIQERTGAGLGSRRVNSGITAMQTMCRWSAKHGRIGQNPLQHAEKLQGQKVRTKRALEDHEIATLLEKSPPIYRRMWVAFLTTGLRKGELAALKWGDIDLRKSMLVVRAETCKVRREDFLPIGPELEAVLREIMPDDPDPEAHVFLNAAGSPWRNNLLKRFKTCLRAAGIDVTGLDLHSLRRTYGTLLAADPRNDVRTTMSLMRHRTVQLTLGLYAQPRVVRQREAIRALDLANRGKTETRTEGRALQLRQA